MANNSALRLVNSAAAADAAAADALATSRRASRILSPAAQAARQQFVWLSQEWGSGTVSDATRDAYVALGKNFPVGPTGQTTGKAVWMSINTLRLQAGMGVLTAPPLYPEQTQAVPAFTLSAIVTGGVLTLTATPASAFTANHVAISATKPLRQGVVRIQPGDYQFLEVATTLPTGGVSLSAAWLSVFTRLPDVGTRIGVRLTPISASGFPGVSVDRSVLVDTP